MIITGPTNQSLFSYDGLGRRTQIIEETNGVAYVTNKYLWDGQTLAEQRDNTGANVQKRFFGQGEQISGTNYYFTADHLGSIREMTDINGNLQARYDYDPYGRQMTVSGTTTVDFGYAGMYMHVPSGLNLTFFRAYDSDSGRWLSRDPLAEIASLNYYSYIGNNSINNIDQLGLIDFNKLGQFIDQINDVAMSTPGGPAIVEGEKLTDVTVTESIIIVKEDIQVDSEAVQALKATADAVESTYDTYQAEKMAKAVEEAKLKYPKKCNKPDEEHHVTPKYLRGDPDGPTVKLPAAYHQLITNAFRKLAPYGQPPPPPDVVQNIVNQVYSMYPLPK